MSGGSVVAVLFAVLLPLLSVGVPVTLLYLAWRFLRAYERRGRADADVIARLNVLEEQMARLGGEVAQLTEGQQFTAALLAGRADAAASAGAPGRAAS